MNVPVRSLVPIEVVVQGLAAQIDSLVRELLPNGRREGHEWVEASRAQGGLGDGLRVHLHGPKAGVWKHFGTGDAGDALDFIALMLFSRDKKKAWAWSMRRLGYSDNAPSPDQQRDASARAEQGRRAAAEEAEKARRTAHARWLQAQPQIAGTPVEYYLAGRGIDLSVLKKQPGAIRFHPELFCREVGERLPAMVTAVTGPLPGGGHGFLTTHRTWLEQAGPGDWRKARLEGAKKVMSGYAGGCISLWRGKTGRSLPRAVDGEIVDVTEGIEDGLSVACAFPDARVVAAISLSNLAAIELPPAISGLCIWRQNDTKPEAIAAYDRARRALLARGFKVFEPDLPEGVKDVNDLLNTGSAA